MPLKVGEIIKIIEADGWCLTRTKGSHRADRDGAKHPEASRHRQEAGVSTYAIIIERSETGSYGAWSPDLLGCVAAADDQDECLRLMKEAIEFHLEGMRRDGDPVPEPSTVAATTFTTAA